MTLGVSSALLYFCRMAFSMTPLGTFRLASRFGTQNRLPDCPPGYYACPTDRREELKFFWVVYQERYWPVRMDGHTNDVLSAATSGSSLSTCVWAAEAINANLEFGLDNAGTLRAPLKHRYAHKSLTKKASRTLLRAATSFTGERLLRRVDASTTPTATRTRRTSDDA